IRDGLVAVEVAVNAETTAVTGVTVKSYGVTVPTAGCTVWTTGMATAELLDTAIDESMTATLFEHESLKKTLIVEPRPVVAIPEGQETPDFVYSAMVFAI